MHDKENVTTNTHDLVEQRRAKLTAWRQQAKAYPTDFRRDAIAARLHVQYGEKTEPELETHPVQVRVAGRIMTRRLMGKASFVHLQDTSGRIQLYLRQNELPEGMYEIFLDLDLGDIVGVEGHLFKTKTGELSVRVHTIRLLTKALQPLPDKYHGLTDQELRYRQRYVDLMVNEETRRTFLLRTKIIDAVRQFLKERDFLEVETPMMQVLAGGAAARPFVTHHHALDMPLYLRIAPELYLKRLVVGGFDRVFEINRNFRNEGLSTQHNPEFTMLEFYQAYADYRELMDLTEVLIRQLAQELLGTTQMTYQGESFDVGQPFQRMTMKQSILNFNPDVSEKELNALDTAKMVA